MRSLVIAGMPLEATRVEWDDSARPAVLVVRMINRRSLLTELTRRLSGSTTHLVSAGNLEAVVDATLVTNQREIVLRLRPVEIRDRRPPA